MTFSGALTLTDLDDFLNPSQACIIPVRNTKPIAGTNGNTEIEIDANNNYYEVQTFPQPSIASGSKNVSSSSTADKELGPPPGPSTGPAQKQALKKAEISLNDCLACSGCITSTESLLITMQSHSEVLDLIKETAPSSSKRTPVLSISPQTLASLAASYSTSTSTPPIPLIILLRRIRAFLAQPSNGGWRVWDTTFSRELSLRETVAEFRERQSFAKIDKGKEVDRSLPAPGPLPMLASACPGWVCYAEKAQGDLLPLLSSARSSQGIMGGLVKSWWASRMGLVPSDIYHVTAMPCYDKKLEASRSDFYSSIYSTKEVDCVLTTGELDLVLQDLGFNPFSAVLGESDLAVELDLSDKLSSPWPELISHPGTSSGSYLHTLLAHTAESHPNPTKLHVRESRGSSDNVEFLLEDLMTGEIVFKGMKTYGFRNLQNLVRKVGKETGIGRAGGKKTSKLAAAVAARRRKGKISTDALDTPTTTDGSDIESLSSRLNGDDKKLDFVEVMACPGGCVNGGGQLKPVTPGSGLLPRSSLGIDNQMIQLDDEGYQRPLPDEGVDDLVGISATGSSSGIEGIEKVDEGMRWSTKEWVDKVESIYWMGYPTPPPSPRPDGIESHGHESDHSFPIRASRESVNGDIIEMVANGEATHSRHQEDGPVGGPGDRIGKEIEEMAHAVVADVAGDDDLKRWEFLRTRFRRVEGDVLGGGISLEAVKW